MPFINGRYHVNPAMGAALEAAREAEAAMLALQDHAQRNGDDSTDSAADSIDDSAHASSSPAHVPIHHVEIEATELEGLPGRRLVEPGRSVPSHSGRATRGYIARIHRSLPQSSANSSPSPAVKPETHVFSDHQDLLNFLHNELSKG